MASEKRYWEKKELLVRDGRALWNAELDMEIAAVATDGMDWYHGKGVAVPEIMLSQMLHAGSDGDKRADHRATSLVLTMRQWMSLATEAYKCFKVRKYEMLMVLKQVRNLPEIDEATIVIDGFFDYVERKSIQPTADVQYTNRLVDFAKNYIEIINKIAHKFAEIERELMGIRAADPYVARGLEIVEETAVKVDVLTRKSKRRPVSSTTIKWVREKWEYYTLHPEAIKGDVAKKRVQAKDVWETIKEAAINKHKIEDFEMFSSILANIRQQRHRVLAEGEGINHDEGINEGINEGLNHGEGINEGINEGLNEGLNHDEGINEGLKEGINEGINRDEGINEMLLRLITESPGIRLPSMRTVTRKSTSTIERAIAGLIATGRIEHRGSKKTGGYYLVKK